TPINVQATYPSSFTVDSSLYYRDCNMPKCYYEALQINVFETGIYVLWSESNVNTYGYIYQHDFNPFEPLKNLLAEHDGKCNNGQFKLIIDLQVNAKYVLVVTTHRPMTTGNFSVFISGPYNVSLTNFSSKESSCIIGHLCNSYVKGIGLTLDDILQDVLRPNVMLNKQSFSIKISAALTIVMFVAGSINAILSFYVFKHKDAQQVGCGIYLLASSIISFLTVTMFMIKFWFLVLTQINVSTSTAVLRGGCESIETILKVCLYLDGWLNVCVAIERAIHVFKGVNFEKAKSKRIARWIVFILPFCITSTLIHEFIYRKLFEYQTEPDKISTGEFCPTPIWNPTGITIANRSIVGQFPITIFVNTNNTVYVANLEEGTIVIWDEHSVNSTKIISGNFNQPGSFFVTSNGDIYVDDGWGNRRVQRWSAETNTFAKVMNVNSSCDGLFVDINDTLYCSMSDHHQVLKRSLNDAVITSNRVAAGTGIEGSGSNQLNSPHGIFADVNMDLYVTDCRNNRVQLFQSGKPNGITVAGNTSINPTITLFCPTGIVLDAEKYLFIVDRRNHRIVGSGLNGFRCLVGCYGIGSQSNQLDNPFSFSFDHSGNMIVTDQENDRIQKFQYFEESCVTQRKLKRKPILEAENETPDGFKTELLIDNIIVMLVA
ncbi:unnamed protein product, partial [Adineta steineri]